LVVAAEDEADHPVERLAFLVPDDDEFPVVVLDAKRDVPAVAAELEVADVRVLGNRRQEGLFEAHLPVGRGRGARGEKEEPDEALHDEVQSYFNSAARGSYLRNRGRRHPVQNRLVAALSVPQWLQ